MLFLSLFLVIQSSDVPYLPEDEFSYEVEFFLKRKPVSQKEEVYSVKPERESRPDVLPYIKIHFNFLKFESTDKRIKIFRDGVVFNSKKIKGPMKLSLDMGYSVDMKEGVTPSEYTIFIFDQDNEKRAKVDIRVEESGQLYINEKISGMI